MSGSQELIKHLENTEKEHSLLENEIRNSMVSVVEVFRQEDQILPASFKPTPRELPIQYTRGKVESGFPNLFPKDKAIILKAISEERPEVKGKRVAVLFSGGPASGGHNVLVGIKKALGNNNVLLGIKSGPKGLLAGDMFEIQEEKIKDVLNRGGFDFLGSDRTKIKTEEQLAQVKEVCKKNNLDALIIIGGDDSNTNAAVLAEYLFKEVHSDGRGVQVIGVPKTIDGDLQVEDLLPISFGFDTATKIYAELVGNILQDTPSSRKYWHFIKLMGRSASHVALEVALQTKPALALISEEVAEKKMSLSDIINNICSAIAIRASQGINHGVVLVPEGLIEFIPEMKKLIKELNEVMASSYKVLESLKNMTEKKDFIYSKISAESAKLMASLPDEFEDMLLLDRDSHGNLQVSQIPTEKLLIEMVAMHLKEMKANPDNFFGSDKEQINLSQAEVEKFIKFKFATNNHFFGYEGRCGAPSKFDAAFTLNLGLATGSLILNGHTGYMATVTNLAKGGEVLAIPLTGLLNVERRHGKDEFVIKKSLVELSSLAFEFYRQRRDKWIKEDCFASPGPRQLWGPIAKQTSISVALNQKLDSLTFDLGKEIKVF